MLNIFLIIALVYFAWLFILSRTKKHSPAKELHYPTVSILLAFRNEEQCLERCISGLKALNYPRDKVEILLLDDQSDDQSVEIAQNLIKDDGRFRLISVPESKGKLQGKMHALSYGIKFAKSEILAVTDADCYTEQDWLVDSIRYMTSKTGLLGAFTHIDDRDNSYFSKLQNNDMHILQTIAARSAFMNKPLTLLGNNMFFRRDAYDEIGGYEALDFSITEDFALMNAIQKTKKWNIVYRFPSKRSRVIAKAEKSFKDLGAQRLRWVAGGVKAPLSTWFYVSLLTISRLIFPLSIFFSFNVLRAGIPALLILFADLYFNNETKDDLKKSLSLMDILSWEFFSSLYTIKLALSILTQKKVTWKKRSYPLG